MALEYTQEITAKLVVMTSAMESCGRDFASFSICSGRRGLLPDLVRFAREGWKRALTLSMIGASWALSFAASYYLSLGDLSSNEPLKGRG